MPYTSLADAVLLLHGAFVAFVILMVPCIFLGAYQHWDWVRLFWLRALHLFGICIVAAQAWAGMICPLTVLEMWLREKGQLAVYTGSFIEHWLQMLLYWDLPPWVFVVAYSLFALLVVYAWYRVPPGGAARSRSSGKSHSSPPGR